MEQESLTDEQLGMLGSALDRTKVAKRKQGNRDVFYVEGHYCIRKMNEIFGFLGWRRKTLRLENVCQSQEADGRWTVSYLAEVEVEVDYGEWSTGYTGCGAGHGINQKRLGDAIESAAKEAETDAMKRAMICLGDQFGLALYDKAFEHVSKASDHIVEKIPAEVAQVKEEEPSEPVPDIDIGGKGKNFKFLRICGEEKKRVGQKAYYEVLNKHGFAKSNAIYDREAQSVVYNDLIALPDDSQDFLDKVKTLEDQFNATGLIDKYDKWWESFGMKPEEVPKDGEEATLKALSDFFTEAND